MKAISASILGMEPLHDDLRLGADGQLWRWTDRGQVTVASGGAEAIRYAQEHGWPERLVELLRGLALAVDQRKFKR